jgi:hypothetical protein
VEFEGLAEGSRFRVTTLGKIRDEIRDQSFFHRQAAKEDKFSDQKIEVFIFLGVLGVLAF